MIETFLISKLERSVPVRLPIFEPAARKYGHVHLGDAEKLLERRSCFLQAPGRASEPLRPQDIADAIADIVRRPRHMAVNEILVRPTEQVR